MALKRNERYPGRFENPTTAQPQGAFKNRTSPTSQDGSYLEADWVNDWSGFFGRLLTLAGVTPNGKVDTASSSQYYDALKSLFLQRTNPFGDIATDGTVSLALSNLGLGTAAKIDVATNDEVISGTENKAVTAASLKNRFNTVVLYPNGTEHSPPTLTANQRIVIDNPFPGRPVVAQVEVFANGIWAEPYFMAAPYGNSGPAAGATPSYLYETDKIVIQTGNDGVLYRSSISGSAHNLSGGGDAFGGSIFTSKPYRLRVRAI